MRKNLLVAAALAVLAVASCNNSSERVYEASMTGSEMAPPVPTASAAAATFKLDPDGTRMTFELMVTSSIDSATGANVRLARSGANGPVVVKLWAGLQGKGFTGWLTTGTLTAADLMGPMSNQTIAALADSMANGVTYVEIHTLEFPGGHIRGQIHEKEE